MPVCSLGFGWCLFSLLIAVVLGLFDKRAEKILKRDIGEGEGRGGRDVWAWRKGYVGGVEGTILFHH